MTIMANRPTRLRETRPIEEPQPTTPEPAQDQEAAKANQVAHVMHVLDETGDTQISWNPGNEVEVEAARQHFNAMQAKGALAYKIGADGSREQIRTFDEHAERIAYVPALQGG